VCCQHDSANSVATPVTQPPSERLTNDNSRGIGNKMSFSFRHRPRFTCIGTANGRFWSVAVSLPRCRGPNETCREVHIEHAGQNVADKREGTSAD
jgi:hypothetical protein